MSEVTQRKLATILAAYVDGCLQHFRADEECAPAALKSRGNAIIDPKLAGHHCRIFKIMGDRMLAKIRSVADAVRAAVETQQSTAERNADNRPHLRRFAERARLC